MAQKIDGIIGFANGSGRSAEFPVSTWIVGIGRGRAVRQLAHINAN